MTEFLGSTSIMVCIYAEPYYTLYRIKQMLDLFRSYIAHGIRINVTHTAKLLLYFALYDYHLTVQNNVYLVMLDNLTAREEN